jgi:nucleotide-binding universal stress UspA family protein
MKILVCTDGSVHSKKALEKASIIAEGSNFEEVAIIHVDEEKLDFSAMPLLKASITSENMAKLSRLREEHLKERKIILNDALKVFEEKKIKARAILKEGHPAHTIVSVASDEGFDMIVIGSRGFSGLEKAFLGSVSNAVTQEAKNCCVVIVK